MIAVRAISKPLNEGLKNIQDNMNQDFRFRVMIRTKLDSLLQLVKAMRKVENLMECHTTLEGVVARRAKEKCIKDSDFNPSVVNREKLVDTVIGVGESATKKLVLF